MARYTFLYPAGMAFAAAAVHGAVMDMLALDDGMGLYTFQGITFSFLFLSAALTIATAAVDWVRSVRRRSDAKRAGEAPA